MREALTSDDIASNGTRAVAVYACGPVDLLEVVRLHRPVDVAVVLDRTPYVEPLVADAEEERWCVVLVNRRNARFFVTDGGTLMETDRVEDDVHSQHDQGGWSQARYQRGVEKEKDDHLVHVAEIAFDRYKQEGFDRLLVGAPDELVRELERKLHPYLRERIPAACISTSRTPASRTSGGRRRRRSRTGGGGSSARRLTGSSRASGAAARAPRASPLSCRRSTRRASRCC